MESEKLAGLYHEAQKLAGLYHEAHERYARALAVFRGLPPHELEKADAAANEAAVEAARPAVEAGLRELGIDPAQLDWARGPNPYPALQTHTAMWRERVACIVGSLGTAESKAKAKAAASAVTAAFDGYPPPPDVTVVEPGHGVELPRGGPSSDGYGHVTAGVVEIRKGKAYLLAPGAAVRVWWAWSYGARRGSTNRVYVVL